LAWHLRKPIGNDDSANTLYVGLNGGHKDSRTSSIFASFQALGASTSDTLQSVELLQPRMGDYLVNDAELQKYLLIMVMSCCSKTGTQTERAAEYKSIRDRFLDNYSTTNPEEASVNIDVYKFDDFKKNGLPLMLGVAHALSKGVNGAAVDRILVSTYGADANNIPEFFIKAVIFPLLSLVASEEKQYGSLSLFREDIEVSGIAFGGHCAFAPRSAAMAGKILNAPDNIYHVRGNQPYGWSPDELQAPAGCTLTLLEDPENTPTCVYNYIEGLQKVWTHNKAIGNVFPTPAGIHRHWYYVDKYETYACNERPPVMILPGLGDGAVLWDHPTPEEIIITPGNNTGTTAEKPISVTDATFTAEVHTSSEILPVFVQFFHPSCSKCAEMEASYNGLVPLMKDKVKICRYNCAENTRFATKYGVKSYPTMLLFNNQPSGTNEILEYKNSKADDTTITMATWLNEQVVGRKDGLMVVCTGASRSGVFVQRDTNGEEIHVAKHEIFQEVSKDTTLLDFMKANFEPGARMILWPRKDEPTVGKQEAEQELKTGPYFRYDGTKVWLEEMPRQSDQSDALLQVLVDEDPLASRLPTVHMLVHQLGATHFQFDIFQERPDHTYDYYENVKLKNFSLNHLPVFSGMTLDAMMDLQYFDGLSETKRPIFNQTVYDTAQWVLFYEGQDDVEVKVSMNSIEVSPETMGFKMTEELQFGQNKSRWSDVPTPLNKDHGALKKVVLTLGSPYEDVKLAMWD